MKKQLCLLKITSETIYEELFSIQARFFFDFLCCRMDLDVFLTIPLQPHKYFADVDVNVSSYLESSSFGAAVCVLLARLRRLGGLMAGSSNSNSYHCCLDNILEYFWSFSKDFCKKTNFFAIFVFFAKKWPY